jgi:hypothetical protein
MRCSTDSVPFHNNERYQEALSELKHREPSKLSFKSQDLDEKDHLVETLLNFRELISSKPFLEHDILWENLDSNRKIANFKQFLLLIALFFFFLVLMTPANVLN